MQIDDFYHKIKRAIARYRRNAINWSKHLALSSTKRSKAKQSKISLILIEGKRGLSLRHKLANSITATIIMGEWITVFAGFKHWMVALRLNRLCAYSHELLFVVLTTKKKNLRSSQSSSWNSIQFFVSTRLDVLLLILFPLLIKLFYVSRRYFSLVLICFLEVIVLAVEIKEWLKRRKRTNVWGREKNPKRNNKHKERFLFLLSHNLLTPLGNNVDEDSTNFTTDFLTLFLWVIHRWQSHNSYLGGWNESSFLGKFSYWL